MDGLYRICCLAFLIFGTTTLRTINGQAFGDACSDSNDICDSAAGLLCTSGVCACELSTMQYFPDRQLCLSGVGTACYLDGTVNCIDNAGCTDNVFDGTGQCACNDGFAPISANSCETPDGPTGPDGTVYPIICCPA